MKAGVVRLAEIAGGPGLGCACEDACVNQQIAQTFARDGDRCRSGCPAAAKLCCYKGFAHGFRRAVVHAKTVDFAHLDAVGGIKRIPGGPAARLLVLVVKDLEESELPSSKFASRDF